MCKSVVQCPFYMGSVRIALVLKACCICLFLIAFCSPLIVVAGELTAVPAIELKGEYDDNVSFLPRNEKADFLATISPSLAVDYDTELLNLDSNIAVSFLRYADETYLDTENQYYELAGAYNMMEKVQLKGDFSYVEDTTLESELEETGLVGVRSNRERSKAGGGISYRVTEFSDIGFNYTHSETDYDWPGNVDYEYDVISLSYNQQLKNNVDVFTGEPYYSWTDSSTSIVNNYGLLAGWSHRYTETMNLTVFLGPRYTKIEYDPVALSLPPDEPLSETSWGLVADIALQKDGEKFTAIVGYNRDLGRSSSGESIETNKLYCKVTQNISRRLLARVSGNLYFTKSEGRFFDEDRRHFDIVPALNYKISEDHLIQFAYSYAYHNEKPQSIDRTYTRNRIWIALVLRFPEKW